MFAIIMEYCPIRWLMEYNKPQPTIALNINHKPTITEKWPELYQL